MKSFFLILILCSFIPSLAIGNALDSSVCSEITLEGQYNLEIQGLTRTYIINFTPVENNLFSIFTNFSPIGEEFAYIKVISVQGFCALAWYRSKFDIGDDYTYILSSTPAAITFGGDRPDDNHVGTFTKRSK